MSAPVRSPNDAGAVPSRSVGARESTRAQPWILAATILASSMVFIDGSVVNVALPSIQAALVAPLSQAQWVVNAYVLTLGALILIGGAAGDRFGRRRVCVAGIMLFTAASVWCGISSSSSMLVAARAAQGVGGALLVPSSLAIISACFPAAQRGRAIGTWAAASALTTALGPVLGGWLVDSVSWRAIFFINVPLALLALGLALRWIPESRNESAAGVDWAGGALAIAGFGMLAYALTAAATVGWSHAAVRASLLACVLLLALFLWWEARASAPMVPLILFRSTTFSGANAITLLLYFALSGELFFLPFDLIDIQGYTAAEAGAAFLPFSVLMAGLSRWTGGLNERYGARLLLLSGSIVVAAGLFMIALAPVRGSYWAVVFPAMLVWGFGMALCVAPLTTAVMSSAGDLYAGAASGINNAVARIAAMLAVALLGVVAAGGFGASLNAQLDRLHVSSAVRQALQPEIRKLTQAQVPQQVDSALRLALRQALDDSFVHSFRVITLIAAAAALLSALCAWLMVDRTPTGSDA